MKNILGLDLGTNSIGWALAEQDFEKKKGKILGVGTRIIPMDAAMLGEFEKGNKVSQTADRTKFRSIRRLRERELLRRERLHRVLNILNFLPEHYSTQIDFEKHYGQFKKDTEPKLVYKPNVEGAKAEFIFKKSFAEMMTDFVLNQPELVRNGKKVPYDWTIYYLRKKALTDKIEKEELAWLLLNFNQKRGYFQLRGEDDEDPTKTVQTRIYFATEKIESIIDTGQIYKELKILKIKLSNGETGKYFNKVAPNWLGIEKNIIVTVDTDKDGKDRLEEDGSIKRKFSIPTDEDWEKKWKLIKIKTEKEIKDSNKTVGTYIYDTLLKNPKQKIKGKLVRVIERNFYKTELQQILGKQKEFHPELNNEKLYRACIEELYPNNESHFKNIEKRDFTYLFLNDIIFYQRPLKTKKSLISDCQYETRNYIDPKTKEKQKLKCIAKSHPLFQEFRLWQFIHNLRIYEKDNIVNGTELDITSKFINTEDDYSKLFDWLNDRKEIDEKAFLKYPEFKLKKIAEKYRWNYVEDKTYPCNKTRNLILNKLDKKTKAILTQENEIKIWHLFYSVTTKAEIDNALKANSKRKSKTKSMYDFLIENNFSINEIEELKKIKLAETDYGSYSEKAIKKLLTLMRRGKYWKEENISSDIKNRISSITKRLKTVDFEEIKIENISDDDIPKQVLKSFSKTKDANPLTGLNTYQACYAVYGRHSESGEVMKWHKPSDIENYLKEVFKQNTLRNPVVEQVIKETLKVVADIWKQYGNSAENFFNEIHIELGREMKNPADKRKSMTNQITENENTNLRIKALIAELKNDTNYQNVRPYSPSQQEILKIYEDGVLKSNIEIPDDVEKISKASQPTKSELIRYKLWLEQKYRSPYTGEMIPLSKLFTTAYEIEHIIPQSRYFDDSFSNKVICESEVNKDKDNCTGLEYISDNPGKIIELSFGEKVKLFAVEDYERFVKEHYVKNKIKMRKLLMLDIPDGFIDRQLNDTRYISKVVKNLLSNIVRENGEDATTSKNVIASNGTITSTLKQDWGLNDVWNDLITPRFVRLNELTKTNHFGKLENKEGKKVFQTTVPLELSKGFSKKRIDHRHHALDALVIACASRNHINYLNNEYAKEKQKDSRFDLKNKLCFKKYNDNAKRNYNWVFHKPWSTITEDSREKLQTTIVSFKQNLRVINKTVNWYQHWKKDENGKIIEKEFIKQTKGENWAVRKPLHADTVKGLVKLNFDKENENTASRFPIDDTFNSKVIERITDTGIQKILGNHLKLKNTTNDNGEIVEHPELAFSQDGIDEMNKNIKDLNDGKLHQPIFKVRLFESKGNKFNVGHKGNKKDKYVEAKKGTNLFFAIYQNTNGERNYKSISFEEVIERQKQGALEKRKPIYCSVPETNEQGDKLLFHLSPNDLVYVPTKEEMEDPVLPDFDKLTPSQNNRIYKFVDGSGTTANFVQCQTATTILNFTNKEQQKLGIKYPIQNEFGKGSPQSKHQKTLDGETQIKSVCWKLEVNRVGKIIKVMK
jgi:CRISPR-associated endonuclease Csn1